MLFRWMSCDEIRKPKALLFLEKWYSMYPADFTNEMSLELIEFTQTHSKKEQSLFGALVKLLDTSGKNQSHGAQPLMRASTYTPNHERPLSGHDEKPVKNDSFSKVVINLRSIPYFFSSYYSSSYSIDLYNKGHNVQSVSFLQFDVNELAQQMTLYDQSQLLCVPRDEYLNKVSKIISHLYLYA